MSASTIILLCIIAAVIFTPLFFAFYRDWDYKRQLSGKKDIQVPKEGILLQENPNKNPQMELDRCIHEPKIRMTNRFPR